MHNTISKFISDTLSACKLRTSQFRNDSEGAVMIIAAFGIMLILVGVLALSLDHGRNYAKQSDLDAKLNSYATHLANDFRQYKYGEFIVMGQQQLAQTPALDPLDSTQHYLTETFLQITEAQAVTKLENRLKQLIQQNPDTQNVGAVKITTGCDTSTDSMMMKFSARIPQYSDFSSSQGNSACMSADTSNGYLSPQEACTLTKTQVRLTVGCTPPIDPINNLNVPEAPCGDGNFQDYPTRDTTPPNSIQAGSAIVELVMSLDKDTKESIISNSSLSALIRNTVYYADIPNNAMAAGLTLGNRPVIGGGVDCLNHNLNLGFSGSCYEAPTIWRASSGRGIPNQSRKFRMEGAFTAQPTRSCNVPPSWTYVRAVTDGNCTYSKASASSTCPTLHGCTSTYDGTNCNYNCTIMRGQYGAACPITERRHMTADQLLDDNNIKAYYSGTLQGRPTSGLGAPRLVGQVLRQPLNTVGSGGSNSDTPQGNGEELENLTNHNTARSWNWTTQLYGPQLSTAEAEARMNLAGAPPATEEYTIQLYPENCLGPNDVACNFPEGYYRMEITAPADLKGEQTMPPGDPSPNTGSPVPDVALGDPTRAHWAYPVNAPNFVSGGACPGEPHGSSADGFDGQQYSYAYVAPPLAAELDAVRNNPMNKIPAERLNVSAVTMERRRVNEEPFTCSVDRFDDPASNTFPANAAAAMVNSGLDRSELGTGNAYPWFAGYDALGTQTSNFGTSNNESPFWDSAIENGGAPDRGIISLTNASGTFTIGAVTENPRYQTRYDGNDLGDPGFSGYDTTGGQATVVQVQALDMVRYMNSDYPPRNKAIEQGGIFNATPDLGPNYNKVDIHRGHVTNQCALAKAGLRKLVAAGGASNEKTLVFVGKCPSPTAYRNFKTLPVNWFAYGNGSPPGTLNGFQLQAMGGPGAFSQAEFEQCFEDIGDSLGSDGNLFIITTAGCEDFAALSKGRSSCMGGCVLGSTDENLPNRISGNCVRSMLECVTGGSVTVPE